MSYKKKFTKPSGTDPWKSVIAASAMSVADLEAKLGMNFFINLPEQSRRHAEESINLSYWGL